MRANGMHVCICVWEVSGNGEKIIWFHFLIPKFSCSCLFFKIVLEKRDGINMLSCHEWRKYLETGLA